MDESMNKGTKKQTNKQMDSKSSWPDLVDYIISILPGWIKISIIVNKQMIERTNKRMMALDAS